MYFYLTNKDIIIIIIIFTYPVVCRSEEQCPVYSDPATSHQAGEWDESQPAAVKYQLSE